MSCQGNAQRKSTQRKPEVVGIDDHIEGREPTDSDDVEEKMDKKKRLWKCPLWVISGLLRGA